MPQEFDAVAQEYDAAFSHTAIGRLLRERVWYCTGGFSRRNPAAKAAGTILELNCGTGEDAIWLAKQGFQVLSTDASPEMVAIAQTKIAREGLAESASVQICSFAEIQHLPEGNFDLIFSNFGGLNCVSPKELEQLGAVFFQKLNPGGKFIAAVMGRYCWWEILYFLLKMKPRAAFRRFSKKPVNARLDAQTTIPTWYYAPSEFEHLVRGRKTLAGREKSKFKDPKSEFQFNSLRSTVKPIGFWIPPSYLNPFFEKRPRLLGFLNFLEKTFAPSWLAFAADHFLICIETKKS